MSAAAAAAGRSFHGWKIVGVGFLTQAVSIGFTVGTFSLFLPALVKEFGASHASVSAGQGVFMAVMTLVGPFIGRLLDRGSIRAVMVAGALASGLSFALMSAAQSLWQLGLLFGIGAAVGTAMLGPLSSATVVAKWFVRQGGRAQGLTNMGGPAGPLLLVVLAGWLIESFGWRATLRIYAVGTLLVIPPIWWFVRNRPEDVGQHPDGAAAPIAGGLGAHADPGWGVPELLRERRFWLLVVPMGLLMGLSSGWVAHFAAFAADRGAGIQQASIALFGGAAFGLLGAFSFGVLADRVDPRRLLLGILVAHVLGYGVFGFSPGWSAPAVCMVALGFPGGGMMPVYVALIGRLFGPTSFGQVMGLAGLVMLPFATLGPIVAGWLHDTSGNYSSALLLFAGLFSLAALILLGLPGTPARPRAAAHSAT